MDFLRTGAQPITQASFSLSVVLPVCNEQEVLPELHLLDGMPARNCAVWLHIQSSAGTN